MLRRIPLPLLLIMVCVTAAHWFTLDWAVGHAPSPLQPMAEPVFARLLEQRQPPTRRPAPAPAPAVRTTRPTSLPPEATPPQPAEAPAPSPAPAPSKTEPPPQPEVVATPAADTPAPPGPGATDTWPPDTRVRYALKGYFRGDFLGDAKVQWQRQGERYQVQVDIHLPLFIQLTLTSQGRITNTGLEPDTYQEVRPGRRDQLTVSGDEVRLNGGQRTPRPDGMQDTASQFVALSQRFARQPELLKVGNEVTLWLGRPNGVDLWTYDIVKEDTLETPKLGAVQAFHLKPRPLAQPRGPVMAELWFAPSLQYLPVRVLITQGDDTFVDLLVEKIEQGAPPAR